MTPRSTPRLTPAAAPVPTSARARAPRSSRLAVLGVLGVLAAGCGTAGLAAAAGPAIEYGTVVSSTPVTAQTSVPVQQCRDEQALVQRPNSGGGALIGALIGGAIGSNIGGGFGRAAATGLGAVAGAAIGDQAEANNNPPLASTVRRCQTVSRIETRLVGYDVVYDHRGQRHTARLAQDPGEQVALEVRVSPAGALPAAPVQAAQGVQPLEVTEQIVETVEPAVLVQQPVYGGPGVYGAVYGGPGYYGPGVYGAGYGGPRFYGPGYGGARVVIGIGGGRWRHGHGRR